MKSITIFVLFTKNNTIFSISNSKGQVKTWISMGKNRNKGLKKLNLVTVHELFAELINYITSFGYELVHLKLKGFNKTKKLVILFFKRSKLQVMTLYDITPKPHNGCRIKNRRRL